MLTPYYSRSGIDLYLGDCRLILPQLTEKVDLVLTGPPYPRGYFWVWEWLSKSCSVILKEDKWLATYSESLYLPEVFQALSSSMTYRATIAVLHARCVIMIPPTYRRLE